MEQDEEETRGYAPQVQQMQTDRGFLAEQTDPAKVLYEIELSLRGMRLNPITKIYEQVRAPLANEEGVGALMSEVRKIVNQNTILSNLNDKEVYAFLSSKCREIRILIAQNYHRYGINESDLSTAKSTILDPVLFALKRCQFQGERNWISKVATERYDTVQRVNTPSRGWASGIFKPSA